MSKKDRAARYAWDQMAGDFSGLSEDRMKKKSIVWKGLYEAYLVGYEAALQRVLIVLSE